MSDIEQYFRNILLREAVDTGPNSPALAVRSALMPMIQAWGGPYLVSVNPSGSFAKGTANRSGTDIDLFLSLSPSAEESLKDIYEKLGNRLRDSGYAARRQNVSWNITVNGIDVDLVPARQQSAGSSDHSLYRCRADTWTKTNVQTHIETVSRGGRTGETRLMKLWRDQQSLDFPSFYLELTVISALGVASPIKAGGGSWPYNLTFIFKYLRDSFIDARVEDPANSNNIISDDLGKAEKEAIRDAADRALRATNWSDVIR